MPAHYYSTTHRVPLDVGVLKIPDHFKHLDKETKMIPLKRHVIIYSFSESEKKGKFQNI